MIYTDMNVKILGSLGLDAVYTTLMMEAADSPKS
jgi:hypothetical protein